MLIPAVRLAKRWTFYIGTDGRVLFVDKDVKVDSAGADVAAKLVDARDTEAHEDGRLRRRGPRVENWTSVTFPSTNTTAIPL